MSNNTDISFRVFNQLLNRIQELEQQNANLQAANVNLLANNDYLRSLLVNKRPREESFDEDSQSKITREESSNGSSSFIGNSECSDSSEDMEIESEDTEIESEDTEIED